MVKLELFMTNGDRRVMERRRDYLHARVTVRHAVDEQNAPGAGFDRAELSALRRLLSQIQDKGQEVI